MTDEWKRRVEVLAMDPAGGKNVGAPATREEERRMAKGLLAVEQLACELEREGAAGVGKFIAAEIRRRIALSAQEPDATSRTG